MLFVQIDKHPETVVLAELKSGRNMAEAAVACLQLSPKLGVRSGARYENSLALARHSRIRLQMSKGCRAWVRSDIGDSADQNHQMHAASVHP